MALATLRYGWSAMFGQPFSRWSLDTMVAAMRETYRERNRLGDDSEELAAGPILDEGVRAFVQGRRLRAQARRAQGTPYYGALFERLGIDPAKLGYDDLRSLPVTPKQALRDDPEAFVPRRARPSQRIASTGTTGTPTTMWFSEDELHLLGALTAVASLVRGTILPDDVVHVAISSRAQMGVGSTARAAAAIGATCHLAGQVPAEVTLALLAAKRPLPGHKPQASVLTIYPSYLGELVETGLRLGYSPADFGVERVLLGGETATEGLRRRAMHLLGEVAYEEGYALTETVPFGGAPCSEGHLHYESIVGILEVLDLERPEPATPGGPGLVVATPLPPFRSTTVLLRYDAGDVVPTFAGPLTCERAEVPATGLPLGKLRHAARHDHGWTFTRDVAEALEEVEAVPLPARYGFRAVPGGVAVEVAVRSGTAAARQAVAERLEGSGVPLAGLRLVEDPAQLRAPIPLRCDLREAVFEPRVRGADVAPPDRATLAATGGGS